MAIKIYPFPGVPADTNYHVFPSELEEDDFVLFHATHVKNLQSIIDNGFKIPDPSGKNGLDSVSFAKERVLALHHAIFRRSGKAGEYCILAVRYPTPTRNGLTVNVVDVHDRTLDPAPEIIGCTTVPESCRHD